MTQPWYSQHSSNAIGVAGNNMNNLEQGYHHHGAAAQGSNMSNYPSAQRTSPTTSIARPPSSASTISIGSMSYNATGAHGSMQSNEKMQSKQHYLNHSVYPMNHGPQGPQNGSDPRGTHADIHHVPARYPMHSHGNNMQQVRPVGRGHFPPSRSHQPMHHRTHGQEPLRQLSNGNNVARENIHPVMNHHSHFGSAKPQMHRPPVPQNPHPQHGHNHHNPLYRANAHDGNMHQMHSAPYNHKPAYAGHGYDHMGRPNSFMPVSQIQVSHMVQPRYDQHYRTYERPIYGSPSTVGDNNSLGHSPSPIPPPPSTHHSNAQASTNLKGSPAPGTSATTQESSSIQTDNKVTVNKPETKDEAKADTSSAVEGKGNNSNDDDDAASILLQLSGLASQAKKSDAANASVRSPNDPSAQAQTSSPRGATGSSPYPQSIEVSSSLEEDATVATVDGTDCAPDLTSEPSSDSVDQKESDFPAPIPENYPTRLALPYDETKLNSLHCFLRSELLEVFVVQKSSHKSPTHSPGSSVGRVGLRCVHCAMVQRRKDDRDEAPMAVFYPKAVGEIYRLVTSWQRCHLRKCKNLPPSVRTKWQLLRDNDKSRGKTHYWITSAKEIGLIDSTSRAGGIRFGPNTKCVPAPDKKASNETEETQVATAAAKDENSNPGPTVAAATSS